MSSVITAIHHIALRVKDFDKSKAFYVNGLDCKVSSEWISSAGFNACLLEFPDGHFVEMFGGAEKEGEADNDKTANGFYHLAVYSEDVDASFEKALQCGGIAEKYPYDFTFPTNPEIPVRLAFVRGPGGESVEFFKYR